MKELKYILAALGLCLIWGVGMGFLNATFHTWVFIIPAMVGGFLIGRFFFKKLDE